MKRDFVEYLTEQDGPIVECINRSISASINRSPTLFPAWQGICGSSHVVQAYGQSDGFLNRSCFAADIKANENTLRIRWDEHPDVNSNHMCLCDRNASFLETQKTLGALHEECTSSQTVIKYLWLRALNMTNRGKTCVWPLANVVFKKSTIIKINKQIDNLWNLPVNQRITQCTSVV